MSPFAPKHKKRRKRLLLVTMAFFFLNIANAEQPPASPEEVCHRLEASAKQNLIKPPGGCWRTGLAEIPKEGIWARPLYRLSAAYKSLSKAMTSPNGLPATCRQAAQRLKALEAFRRQVQSECQTQGTGSAQAAAANLGGVTGQKAIYLRQASLFRDLQAQRTACHDRMLSRVHPKDAAGNAASGPADTYAKFLHDLGTQWTNWVNGPYGPAKGVAEGFPVSSSQKAECLESASKLSQFADETEAMFRQLQHLAVSAAEKAKGEAGVFQDQSASAGKQAASLEARAAKLKK